MPDAGAISTSAEFLLYKVLEFFGFGDSIISWIKLFNNNASLSVNLGGHLSSTFNIGRGCRQGDPVSPFLFILCVEILGIMIRNNKDIKGIIINDKEHKLSQYADDTLFFLDGTSKSLSETLNVLSEFARFSGLKINFGKTHAVWIGLKKYSTASIKTRWKLCWGKTDFKLLGIIYQVNLDEFQNVNYKDKIQKIKSLIKLWKRRYLTPLGKITVIKTLLLPILNHLFISIPNPSDTILKELNNMFYEFLWEGPAKIKQSVVVKEYCEGGLKMINLKAFMNSMKITWLRRIIVTDSPWQSVIRNTINFNEIFSFGTNYIDLLLPKIKNKFWTDVLKAYSELITANKIEKEDQILSCPIFNNIDIKVGNITVCIKSWHKKGVIHVNDLVKENGQFLSQNEFENRYNTKTNFIQFQGIIHAIKDYARKHGIINFTKNLKMPFIPINIFLLIKSKKGGKDFYSILNNNNDKPTSQPKWENTYNIEQETWKDIYVSPFNLPIGTKLQWFQVRINHRVLPTRKLLHKMKYVQNSTCNYCGEEETISHLLWTCPESQSLIRQLTNCLINKNVNLSFIEESFIFNIGNTYTTADLQLFIIIKHYMYATKCLNQPLSLIALLRKIKYIHCLEQHTATVKNCLDKFEEKWLKYRDFLLSIH